MAQNPVNDLILVVSEVLKSSLQVNLMPFCVPN